MLLPISPVVIFIVCYMLDKIWVLVLKEPPQWIFRLVTWLVGVVLVLIVAYGPIRLG